MDYINKLLLVIIIPDKPGTFDFKGKYKWQAWKDLEGKSQEDAEKEYIDLATELISKYN